MTPKDSLPLPFSVPPVKRARRQCGYLVAASVLVGSIYTALAWLPPGSGNQAEDLPKILRLLNPEFLANDQFVNSSDQGFSIRFYYAHIMAFLVDVFGLNLAMFTTCLVLNVATVLVTACAGYKLFGNSLRAGLISAVLSTQTAIKIASSYEVLAVVTLANFLAMLFVYCAIYLIVFRNRFVSASIFLGVSSLIQPLSGIAAFGFCILGFVAINLAVASNGCDEATPPLKGLRLLRITAVGTTLFACFAAAIVVPYIMTSGSEISDRRFVELFAFFRIPHHSLPSEFLTIKTLVALAAASTLIFIVFKTRTFVTDRRAVPFIGAFFAAFLVALLFNFLFVEVYPTRIFATLVPVMKLSSFLNWFTLVCLSGFLAHRVDRNRSSVIGWLSIGALSVTTAQGLELAAVVLTLTIVIFIVDAAPRRLVSSMSVSSLLFTSVACLAAAVVVATLALGPWHGLSEDSPGRSNTGVDADLFGYVTTMTPTDAIFLVPHDFHQFRLSANRAIVAAFKTYPANDTGLDEWFQRMMDSYTCTQGRTQGISTFKQGFDFESSYSKIDDACLAMITRRYGASYAVLPLGVLTSHPVLFADESYKLVALD